MPAAACQAGEHVGVPGKLGLYLGKIFAACSYWPDFTRQRPRPINSSASCLSGWLSIRLR